MPSSEELHEFRLALKSQSVTAQDTAVLRMTSVGSLVAHLLVFATIMSLPEQVYVRPVSNVSLYPVQEFQVIVLPPKEPEPEPEPILKELKETKPPMAVKPMKRTQVAKAKTKQPRRKVVQKRRKKTAVQKVQAKRTPPQKVIAIQSPDSEAPAPVEAEVVSNDAVVDKNASVESDQGSDTGEERVAEKSSDKVTDVDLNAMLAGYMRLVHRNVRRYKTYPRAAARAGLEGRVELAIVIDKQGKIVSSRIHKSSGIALLDKAALKAVARLDRMPAPPAQLSWQKRTIYVPFVYKLG